MTPSPLSMHDPDQRARGLAALRRADSGLGSLIERFGDLWSPRRATHFELLCRIIIDQQISIKAAATIANRLREACGGKIRPDAVSRLEDPELRRCGLSRQKLAALRDLSERVLDGRLNTAGLWRLSEDEAREQIIAVRGLGPWSADMFILFALGRPDVWATGDLGLRNALQRLDGLDEPPRVPAMIARADRWKPWRGLASLYLWASLEPEPKHESTS